MILFNAISLYSAVYISWYGVSTMMYYMSLLYLNLKELLPYFPQLLRWAIQGHHLPASKAYTMLVKQVCNIQTKMYRLLREMILYGNYTSACLGRSGAYSVTPWCYVRTWVHAYVKFVMGISQMSHLTSNLTCKFYIHIYVYVSLGAHNFGYHHAIPFKFGMILT